MTDLDVHLDAIRAGDARAFGSWLAGAEPVLRLRLRSFAKSVDVEAVLQESLLRTWQVAPKVKQDGKANALLRIASRICRNHAIDVMRRERVAVLEPEVLEAFTPVTEPIHPDPALRKHLAECRDQLPKRPGAALQARLGTAGARSDRDLALSLDMKLNTFLKNVGRARALLLECLGRSGITLEWS